MTDHRCPPWCHECPDITAIVRGRGEEPGPLDIMPFCQSGLDHGLEACYCSHEDPHLATDVVARARWFAEEARRTYAAGLMDDLRARRRVKRGAPVRPDPPQPEPPHPPGSAVIHLNGLTRAHFGDPA